jgi:hypothetical protein
MNNYRMTKWIEDSNQNREQLQHRAEPDRTTPRLTARVNPTIHGGPSAVTLVGRARYRISQAPAEPPPRPKVDRKGQPYYRWGPPPWNF